MLKTFLVDGDKGGVGKTTVARAIADAYANAAANHLPACKVVCLDADHTNPDFCGTGGYVPDSRIHDTGLVNLDEPKNWLELVNALEDVIAAAKTEEVRVIISMPATAKRAFESSNEEVMQVLNMLNAVPVWVMGRTADSVTQLESRVETMPRQYEHGLVVTNLFFGTRDKFVLWDTSAARKELIGSEDWLEASLPELSDLVVTKIGRTPYHQAIESGTGTGGQKLGMGDIIGLRAFSSRAGAAMAVVEKIGGK